MPASMRQAQAEDWFEDLGEFGAAIVASACREWRQQPGGRRPTPGDIRALCIAEQQRGASVPQIERRRELTPEEIEVVANGWAREHGFAGIADYQRHTRVGVVIPIGGGKVHRFPPLAPRQG